MVINVLWLYFAFNGRCHLPDWNIWFSLLPLIVQCNLNILGYLICKTFSAKCVFSLKNVYCFFFPTKYNWLHKFQILLHEIVIQEKNDYCIFLLQVSLLIYINISIDHNPNIFLEKLILNLPKCLICFSYFSTNVLCFFSFCSSDSSSCSVLTLKTLYNNKGSHVNDTTV